MAVFIQRAIAPHGTMPPPPPPRPRQHHRVSISGRPKGLRPTAEPDINPHLFATRRAHLATTEEEAYQIVPTPKQAMTWATIRDGVMQSVTGQPPAVSQPSLRRTQRRLSGTFNLKGLGAARTSPNTTESELRGTREKEIRVSDRLALRCLCK